MLSTIALSGIVGLIGGIADKITNYKTKKLELEMEQKKFEHEVALRKVDAEIMAQEWKARTQVAQIEGDAMVEAEDAKAFAKSYDLEPKKYGIKWLDALRGSIRPVLTVYLVGITSVMYYRSDGGKIDAALVAETILSLTVLTVGWWFGSRQQTVKKTK